MQLQALLVSGGSDGLLVLWSADHAAGRFFLLLLENIVSYWEA